MKKVLYIFGQLNNQDVEWLAENGRKIRLAKSEELVSKGNESHHLYIILEGSLAVMNNSIKFASIGSGEVVGEMSFLDGRKTSATVKAETDCIVYSILTTRIKDKIKTDEGFGLRLYRALALFLTERLRFANSRNYDENIEETETYLDELNSIMTDNIGEAGRRFLRLLSKMNDF